MPINDETWKNLYMKAMRRNEILTNALSSIAEGDGYDGVQAGDNKKIAQFALKKSSVQSDGDALTKAREILEGLYCHGCAKQGAEMATVCCRDADCDAGFYGINADEVKEALELIDAQLSLSNHSVISSESQTDNQERTMKTRNQKRLIGREENDSLLNSDFTDERE